MDHYYEAVREINQNPDTEKDAYVVAAVNAIIDLAEIGRKEGLLTLEETAQTEEMESVPNCAYLRTLIMLVVDGTDPEQIRKIGEIRLTASMAKGYEALIRIMYLEGMLSVQAGENPRTIAMKMLAFCPDRILKLFEKENEYMPGCEISDWFVRQKILIKSKKENKEEHKKTSDVVRELCNTERTGIQATGEEYFEIRLLEYCIKNLDDKAIQRILREIENIDLEVVISILSGKANECFFRNLSARLGEMIAEEIRYMPPVRLADSKNSVRKLLRIIYHLAHIGDITLCRGEASELFFELLKEYDEDTEKQIHIKQKEDELELLFREYKNGKNRF